MATQAKEVRVCWGDLILLGALGLNPHSGFENWPHNGFDLEPADRYGI